MSSELFDLTGETAVVTGAGRGIGEGIAKVLAGAGIQRHGGFPVISRPAGRYLRRYYCDRARRGFRVYDPRPLRALTIFGRNTGAARLAATGDRALMVRRFMFVPGGSLLVRAGRA